MCICKYFVTFYCNIFVQVNSFALVTPDSSVFVTTLVCCLKMFMKLGGEKSDIVHNSNSCKNTFQNSNMKS